METRQLKMICKESKLGHSLSQISELTGLTIDQVKEGLGQATGLSPEALSNIFNMKQQELSVELISQESNVDLEVLEQFLPQVIKKTVEAHAVDEGPYEISIDERARMALLTTARPTADHLLRRLKRPNSLHNLRTSLASSTAANTSLASCTGLISSLENSHAMNCLVTGSSTTVVGVSCLEEVCSSLVVVRINS
jgi:hypothetical protein